jgi:acyl-CoA synthetase (AMP-forming)/AMP-acid ligase II
MKNPPLIVERCKSWRNYALIINNNAGLWGYNIGDTVKFVSTEPYRLVVSGRTKHFISAFGEHVIGEEVEAALLKASNEEKIAITEFTVAPFIAQDAGKVIMNGSLNSKIYLLIWRDLQKK